MSETIEVQDKVDLPVDEIATEQQDAEGSESAEVSTPDTAEVEVEPVDIETLAGTQPESDAGKEHNKLHASIRVKTKRLKELEAAIERGEVPTDHAFKPKAQAEKPKLTDFTNEERLYDEFGGNAQVALAAYNEAKEEWEGQTGSLKEQEAAHNENLKAQIQAEIEKEQAFEAAIEKHSKYVRNLSESVDSATELLGEPAVAAIRDAIGENSPLVLATLGKSGAEYAALQEVVKTGNPNAVVRHLTRLEDKILANLPSTKISRATPETPLGSGAGAFVGDIDEKMRKAASAMDFKEYERLKAIKKAQSQ